MCHLDSGEDAGRAFHAWARFTISVTALSDRTQNDAKRVTIRT